jgi:hypothetical protein
MNPKILWKYESEIGVVILTINRLFFRYRTIKEVGNWFEKKNSINLVLDMDTDNRLNKWFLYMDNPNHI